MKEIEEDTKKWKNIPSSGIGRINIIKMSMLPRTVYSFMSILIKIPSTFFKEMEKIILKFVWNQKRPRIAKGMLKKENQSWWHHNSGHQALLQSCNYQDSMVLAQKQTHRSMEQNREPRNGPPTLRSTDLQQGRKECPMEKRQSLQQMVLGKLDNHIRKNETGPFPYTTHKNRLKMKERPTSG